jgi:hypothetical protein
MQMDYNQMNQGGQLDKMLSTLPYPVAKDEIVMHMQQAGASSQMVTAMKQALPDRMFNKLEEIKSVMQRVGEPRH